jgi:prepilin-type N-terminal cleavage/methylation domain-containing protein
MSRNKQKGFTLIELLVGIAIIGILSSVVLPQLGVARKKASDAKRTADTQQISKALIGFYAQKGRMPGNYNCWDGGSGHTCVPGQRPNRAACDAPLPDVPGGGIGVGYVDASMVAPDQYNQAMQELVDAGYMSNIPHSAGSAGYCYVDMGPGNPEGAMIVTVLEESQPTTTGLPPSCRPNSAGQVNWCTQDSNQQYCLCNSY